MRISTNKNTDNITVELTEAGEFNYLRISRTNAKRELAVLLSSPNRPHMNLRLLGAGERSAKLQIDGAVAREFERLELVDIATEEKVFVSTPKPFGESAKPAEPVVKAAPAVELADIAPAVELAELAPAVKLAELAPPESEKRRELPFRRFTMLDSQLPNHTLYELDSSNSAFVAFSRSGSADICIESKSDSTHMPRQLIGRAELDGRSYIALALYGAESDDYSASSLFRFVPLQERGYWFGYVDIQSGRALRQQL